MDERTSLEGAYRRKLRACGFRSWKRANARRGELIESLAAGTADERDRTELEQLQALADLRTDWKDGPIVSGKLAAPEP